MKRSTHFLEHCYGPWHRARATVPSRPGWYECAGWRFNGLLHLLWDGKRWLYFGPKHHDPSFPMFGQHPTDVWRGLTEDAHVGWGRWGGPWTNGRGKIDDLTGKTFGLLTAISLAYLTRRGAHWMCRCECGAQRVLMGKWLSSGNTGSCGCRQFNKFAVPINRPWARKR